MKSYPQSMLNLMRELGKMPGIGQKSAERIAHYILKQPNDEAMQLAVAIRNLKQNVSYCSICCNIGRN